MGSPYETEESEAALDTTKEEVSSTTSEPSQDSSSDTILTRLPTSGNSPSLEDSSTLTQDINILVKKSLKTDSSVGTQDDFLPKRGKVRFTVSEISLYRLVVEYFFCFCRVHLASFFSDTES